MAIARQESGIARVDMESATITMCDDGSFTLLVGATDLGTGSDTILSQICAETLGVDFDNVEFNGKEVKVEGYNKKISLEDLATKLIYTKKQLTASDSYLAHKSQPPYMSEFAESYESTGPFSAKSIGEVVINSSPPAIQDAIFNATGVRVRFLPITPEKVLKGLKELGKKK